MNAPDRFCVIVDGYSSGNLIAPELRRRGLNAVHVQSTPEIWPVLFPTFHPEDYAANFAFGGDLDALAAAVSPYSPLCVFAGTETGVELADALSERLGVATNGTAKSAARRDKYLMIEAVRAYGLRAAAQTLADHPEAVARWVAEHGLTRVVVKPVKSAGTDGVAVCRTADEIRAACRAILGTTNQLGLPNTHVLAQEFLGGMEYAVDAVSLDGRPHFTAIWRYHKVAVNGGEFVYDRDELIPCDDELGNRLCAYVSQVLEALGVKHGPSHAEVKIDTKGPVLIEIGTRLNGVTTPHLHERCVGYGQLDLTVDAYTDPQSFRRKASTPYRLKEHALSVSLLSHTSGTVKSVPGEAKVKALPSFDELRLRARPGYQLRPTVDYFTSPGFVMLVHPEKAVLERDLATLRALEGHGMYELEESPTR